MILSLFFGVLIFDSVHSILHQMSVHYAEQGFRTHCTGTLHINYRSSGFGDFGSRPANGLILDFVSWL